MSCGIGCRHGLDPEFLWLWLWWAAVALIRSIAWDLLYALGATLKRPNNNKKNPKKTNQNQNQNQNKKQTKKTWGIHSEDGKIDAVLEASNAEVALKDDCVWVGRIWGTLHPLPLQVQKYRCWWGALQVLKTKQNSDWSKTLQWILLNTLILRNFPVIAAESSRRVAEMWKDMTPALKNGLSCWRKIWLSIFLFPASFGREQHAVHLAEGHSLIGSFLYPSEARAKHMESQFTNR